MNARIYVGVHAYVHTLVSLTHTFIYYSTYICTYRCNLKMITLHCNLASFVLRGKQMPQLLI